VSATDWVSLLLHFLALSMLSVGGAISVAPDIHRYLVEEKRWLLDPQFNASISIAQAAPGPNVLFIALMGWNVGMNAGGTALALLGTAVCMVGILAPSSVVTYLTSQWSHRNRDRREVRAFKLGMTPIVIALMAATGWILATNQGFSIEHWPSWLVTLAATLLVWRTKLHLLWLLAAGAVLGWFGLV